MRFLQMCGFLGCGATAAVLISESFQYANTPSDSWGKMMFFMGAVHALVSIVFGVWLIVEE